MNWLQWSYFYYSYLVLFFLFPEFGIDLFPFCVTRKKAAQALVPENSFRPCHVYLSHYSILPLNVLAWVYRSGGKVRMVQEKALRLKMVLSTNNNMHQANSEHTDQ